MKLLCFSLTFIFFIHFLRGQKGSIKQFKYRYSLHEPYSFRRKKTGNGLYCGCPRVFSPACATNNITYVNACILKCWKKTLKKAGPCVTWRPRGYGNKITEVYVPRGWRRREDQPQYYEKSHRLPAYERKVTGTWFFKVNTTGQNSQISKQKLAEAKFKERFSEESNSNSSESNSPKVPEQKDKNFTSLKQCTSYKVGTPKKTNMINDVQISKISRSNKTPKMPNVLISNKPSSRASKTPKMPNLLLTTHEPLLEESKNYKTPKMPSSLLKLKQSLLGEKISYKIPIMLNIPLMLSTKTLEESKPPKTLMAQSILQISKKLSLGQLGPKVAEVPNMLLKSNKRLLDESMLFNTPKTKNVELMSNELSLEVIESPNTPEQEKFTSQGLSKELLIDKDSQKIFEPGNEIQDISIEHQTIPKIRDQQKPAQWSKRESIAKEVFRKMHRDQNEIVEMSNERPIEELWSSDVKQQKLKTEWPNEEGLVDNSSPKLPEKQSIIVGMSKEQLIKKIKSANVSKLKKIISRKWKHYPENSNSPKITKKKKNTLQKSTKCSLDSSVTKLPRQALTLKISIKRAGELGFPNLMKQLNVAIEKQKKISSGLSDALVSQPNKTMTTKIIHIKFA